jgi:hypothetical protein
MKKYLIILVFLLPLALFGQNPNSLRHLSGRILNKNTRDPIAFANIYNRNLKTLTISNKEGYYKIAINSASDSVFVSYVGFQKQLIHINENATTQTILLEESVQLLNTVTITASKNDWIYGLLSDCKRHTPYETNQAKAYYELKSFCEGDQIELVEAFFNAELKGAELDGLQMKTGRFGLKKKQDRFFNSMESSQAILQMRVFERNDFFPGNPFELSTSKMRKNFNLYLEKKYLDQNSDSIYVIVYYPRDISMGQFSGKIWINPLKKQIQKIIYECQSCKTTPFSPLFDTDSILNTDMSIKKEFREVAGNMVFSHIDFTYEFEYRSRNKSKMAREYRVKSNAILYVYDYEKPFDLPRFQFSENCKTDYLKINAIPYNEFFWLFNNEFKMFDFENRNDDFYYQDDVITNRTWYSENPFFKKVYEAPFVTWSDKRILFRDDLGTKSQSADYNPKIISDSYKLGVKIFLDINTYADSTNVITSTVLDPWDTYYYLPVDSVTNCFFNIYFDIHEFERRKFMKEICQRGYTSAQILRKYDELSERISRLSKEYLKEVERGTNRKQLEKWNQYIVKNMGIDNMSLFNLL